MAMLQDKSRAVETLKAMGEAFASIENPPGIFPIRELVPLGRVRKQVEGHPSAIFLDMDGTITCTEPLFLHGVEEVVRRATGWHTKAAWAGLDAERDHPNIVGFNTQRNLEYLHTLHGEHMVSELFFPAVQDALVFLCEHPVPEDIRSRLKALLEAYGLDAWWRFGQTADRDAEAGLAIQRDCVRRFPRIDQSLFAQFGLVIFYADYIDALARVSRGDGAAVSLAVLGDENIPAVAPMPGIALLCALVRGWLPESAAGAIAALHDRPDGGEVLAALCRKFSAQPVPIALVTSSGAHETELVLQAVFRAMREEVQAWPIDEGAKMRIVSGFAGPASCFHTSVTCDDVIDGRTKPFRDPYTLALQRLGLDGDGAQQVIGFEDTEAGVIAQRGAGVGVPCGVPIEFTLSHDFSAAAHVLHGGVLEAIFAHGLFIP